MDRQRSAGRDAAVLRRGQRGNNLNVVCFRYRRRGCAEEQLNEINKELLMRFEESGIAVVSSTILEGKFALRAAIVNHRSRKEDFQILVDAVVKIGANVAEENFSGLKA